MPNGLATLPDAGPDKALGHFKQARMRALRRGVAGQFSGTRMFQTVRREIAFGFVLGALLGGLSADARGQQAVVYVNSAATGSNDGSSWQHAFTDLQAALQDGTARTVWIAAGTYRPGPPGATGAVFRVGGRSMFGGFAGHETTVSQRNVLANPTILTGDLLGDDAPEFMNRSDNTRVVVQLDTGFLISDLFIRGGVDAGIEARSTLAQISNCVIADNPGAGIRNAPPDGLSCYIQDSWFLRNGGTALDVYGRARVMNCVFQINGMVSRTAAVVIDPSGTGRSDSNIVNCDFLDDMFGGVFAAGGPTQDQHVYLTNCILRGCGPTAFSGRADRQAAWCNIEGFQSGDLENAVFWPMLDADPMFFDRDGEDNIAGTIDDNLRLALGSPCIDAGGDSWISNPGDIEGTPRKLSCRVDIGAYETWAHIRDCDGDGIADACAIAEDRELDIDVNGIPDRCDAWFIDCNENGVADRCEPDSDGDGVIDACEGLTTPLKLGPLPANVTVTALDANGAYVAFGLPEASGGSGAVTVTSDFAAGSLLPVGTTTITITAADAAGRTVNGAFAVTVLGPDGGPGENPDGSNPDEPDGDDEVQPPTSFAPCGVVPGLVLLLVGLTLAYRRREVLRSGVNGGSPRTLVLLILAGGTAMTLGPLERARATDCNGNGIPDETEWAPPSDFQFDVYVDPSATGANTGASWDDALTDLQAGLCTALRLRTQFASRNPIIDLYVAAGVYRPAGAAENYDPTRSFDMVRRMRMHGSYTRGTDGTWSADVDRTPTILDGDLLGDDAAGWQNYDDNAHTVVRCVTNGQISQLDLNNVHIRGGNSPTDGGGIRTDGLLRLFDCRVYENRAQHAGGGVFAAGPDLRVTSERTLFHNNEAPIGSAQYCGDGASMWMFSNIVTGNGVLSGGPAIERADDTAQAVIENCTIVGNPAGAYRGNPSLLTLFSADIVWHNGATSLGHSIVEHSLIEGGWPGEANIDGDPLFIDEAGADGLLGTIDDDYRLAAASPCVNADRYNFRSLDYDRQPGKQQCATDMGALESAYFPDCDASGRSDDCEISAFTDVNRDEQLDICQPCVFTDCDGNGVQDMHQWDVDGDGVIDTCDAFPHDPQHHENPPIRLACPARIEVQSRSIRGAAIALALPAAEGGIGTVTVTSDAPADGVFPIGQTRVTIQASDGAGNQATCGFDVIVLPLN